MRTLGACATLSLAACVPEVAERAPAPVPTMAAPAPVRFDPAPLIRRINPRFVLSGTREQGGVMLGTAPEGTTALTLGNQPVAMAPDRRFLVAFDRDAPSEARLVATLDDGRRHVEAIAVAARDWRIERLDSLPRLSQPSERFLALRRPELARIAAARAVQTGADGWRQRFVWPVRGRISGLFGSQRVYRGEPGAYHSGVDVARPTGTPVVAPADGFVILAADAPFTLEGRLLMIDHGAGLNSAFLHLSRIDVSEGAAVRQGQQIGAVGATGRATGPHLHWSMKWHDARIDPLLVAGPMAD